MNFFTLRAKFREPEDRDSTVTIGSEAGTTEGRTTEKRAATRNAPSRAAVLLVSGESRRRGSAEEPSSADGFQAAVPDGFGGLWRSEKTDH